MLVPLPLVELLPLLVPLLSLEVLLEGEDGTLLLDGLDEEELEVLEELEDLSSLPQHPVKASDITSTTATMRAENFKCFMLLHPFLTILILLPPPGVPKQKTNGFFVSSFSLHSPPRIIYPGQRYILTFCLQQ